MPNEEPKADKRPVRSKYKVSTKRIKIAAAACLAIAIIILILMSPLFKIKKIEVRGNSLTDSNSVIDASAITKGENIFTINITSAVKAINSFDRVSAVTIKRALPGKVIISVKEEGESAYIKIKKGFAGIDSDGKILATGVKAEYNVPVISGIELIEPENGQFMKIKSEKAKNVSDLTVRILTELKNQGIINKVKAINMKNLSDLQMTLTSDTIVNLGADGKKNEDRIEYKLAFLKALMPEISGQIGGVIELSDTSNVTGRMTK